ncbi:MAG: polysaccharide biosynthesis/export family protein [Phycisphaeraceae bacterium]|nr:polysaccharide biosynthesis/export family protein [Phycisphaeraceae bacterium]
MSRTHRNFVSITVAGLAVVLLSGCFTSHPRNIDAFVKPNQVNTTAEEYVLMPPDEITIHCSRVPEIDGQSQRIRPDGKISFESLGEIDVAGKTPEEVTTILEQKAASLYNLPGDKPIDVRLIAYQSKRIYVLGQVFSPGPKVYTGRDSVLTALAGRLNPMAWKSRVQVIRPSEEQDVPPKIFEINYTWMAKHGDLRKNVLLEEGDIIYVPPTPFAAVAMAIEQVMRPISRALTGTYMVEQGFDGTPEGSANAARTSSYNR